MESAPLLRMISMATGKTLTSQQRTRDAEVCTTDVSTCCMRAIVALPV
jgi:hypothetical protein